MLIGSNRRLRMIDLGGIAKYMCEAIDTEPHALSEFDREVDALRQILGVKRLMSVDELRRGIEAIPEAEYHGLTYYQRWIRSIADNLLRKGVITASELARLPALLVQVGGLSRPRRARPARRARGMGHDAAG
jgi:nitrile hydratase subunit beta